MRVRGVRMERNWRSPHGSQGHVLGVLGHAEGWRRR